MRSVIRIEIIDKEISVVKDKYYVDTDEIIELIQKLKLENSVNNVKLTEFSEFDKYEIELKKRKSSIISKLVIILPLDIHYSKKFDRILEVGKEDSFGLWFKKRAFSVGLATVISLTCTNYAFPLSLSPGEGPVIEQNDDVDNIKDDENTYLDGFITTIQEKGLVVNDDIKINNNILEEFEYLKCLDTSDSIVEAYDDANKYLTTEINDSIYYDSINNNINKEEMTKRIAYNTMMYNSASIVVNESFTDEEIAKLVDQFYIFIDQTVREYPKLNVLDLSNILCNTCLIKLPTTNTNVYAYTYCIGDDYYLEWNSLRNINLDEYQKVNFHEFTHLEEFISTRPDDVLYQPFGVSLVYIRNHDNLDSYNNYLIDNYNFSFLSEWSAEKHSSDLFYLNPSTYLIENEVVNNLQLILSLNPDYEIDSILEDFLYKNPFSFMSRFPINQNNIKDDLVFINEMLGSYDLALTNGLRDYTFAYNSIDNTAVPNEDVRQQAIDNAEISSYKLFFYNLILMNENYNVPIDYNFYLINLFEKSIDKERELLETSDFYSTFEENYNTKCEFLTYLANKNNIEYSNLLKEYDSYDGGIKTFPTFVSDTSRKFYQNQYENLNEDIYLNASELLLK